MSLAGLKPSTLKSFSERGLPLYACVDNDEAGSRFTSENNLIPCNKVLADSGVKDFNELLQKTVRTRELIDKSQSAQNFPPSRARINHRRILVKSEDREDKFPRSGILSPCSDTGKF